MKKKIAAKMSIKQHTDAEVLAHMERKAKAAAEKAAPAKKAAKTKAAAEPAKKAAVKPAKEQKPFQHDERVLAAFPVGSVIVKEYKRRDQKDAMIVEIKVVADGFVYNDKPYKSLSAIGNILTGWNSTDGLRFFGFTKRAK